MKLASALLFAVCAAVPGSSRPSVPAESIQAADSRRDQERDNVLRSLYCNHIRRADWEQYPLMAALADCSRAAGVPIYLEQSVVAVASNVKEVHLTFDDVSVFTAINLMLSVAGLDGRVTADGLLVVAATGNERAIDALVGTTSRLWGWTPAPTARRRSAAEVEPWAEIVAAAPGPDSGIDADARRAIVDSGLPWVIRDRRSGLLLTLIPPGRCSLRARADPITVAVVDYLYASVARVSLGGMVVGERESGRARTLPKGVEPEILSADNASYVDVVSDRVTPAQYQPAASSELDVPLGSGPLTRLVRRIP